MSEVTIVALFDHYETAGQAVRDIIKAGAASDKISLLANTLTGDHPALITNPAYAREEIDAKEESQPGVVTGAEFGIGLGGLAGLLVGSGAIVIPGIGPLIAAGAWAAIAAGVTTGGVVGGVIGLLTSHDISNKDAHLYAEGLKRGGTLVTVIADEAKIEAISRIFIGHGAIDIGKRGAAWSAEGWVGFDPHADTLLAKSLTAADASTLDDNDEARHAVRHYFKPQNTTGGSVGGATNTATHYAEDEMKS
jgi:hypothetical protein